MSQSRSVSRIVQTQRQLEGAGFVVRRPFPTRGLDHFDPFLLLDHLGPVDQAPGQAKGAPDHPHRGFETVTYVLEGRMEHKDSQGHAGQLGPGDVQWMTAGAGVVHSEMPEREFQRTGGRLHGFQLWVNLPAKDKLMKPRYQELKAADLPTGQSADGKAQVTVIAGEALGARAQIDTRTPIFYLHFRLQPGAQVVQPAPPGYSAFAYVVEGRASFGPDRRAAAEGQMVAFAGDGDTLELAAPDGPASVLVIGGVPLGEPVARYGPFVMNTEAELEQAFEDYRTGRMGRIDF